MLFLLKYDSYHVIANRALLLFYLIIMRTLRKINYHYPHFIVAETGAQRHDAQDHAGNKWQSQDLNQHSSLKHYDIILSLVDSTLNFQCFFFSHSLSHHLSLVLCFCRQEFISTSFQLTKGFFKTWEPYSIETQLKEFRREVEHTTFVRTYCLSFRFWYFNHC